MRVPHPSRLLARVGILASKRKDDSVWDRDDPVPLCGTEEDSRFAWIGVVERWIGVVMKPDSRQGRPPAASFAKVSVQKKNANPGVPGTGYDSRSVSVSKGITSSATAE